MSRLVRVSEPLYRSLKKLSKIYRKPMPTIGDAMQHCVNLRELDDILANRKIGSIRVFGRLRK